MRPPLVCLLLLGAILCGAANLDQLLAAHRASPGDWKIAHQVALAYTERNQFAEAAEFYRKALTGNPGFVPARKNLAVVLWFATRRTEAEAVFRKLSVEIPRDPVPQLYLGLAAHDRGQHAEAHRRFAAAGDLALNNPDVLPQVVESYLAAKDNSVLARAASVLTKAQDVELSLRTAAVLDRYGAAEAAYNTYREALTIAPAHEMLYIAFASFASAHQNNQYGIEILDRGLKHHANSAPLRFHRGLLIALQGDREAAAKEFRKAADADPRWTPPALAAGVLELEDGRPGDAAATFARVVRDHPTDQHALYLRALALSRTGDESTRAEQVKLLERAVQLNSRDARALALLGQSYLAAGRSTEAIARLKKSVAADAENPIAHYHLALALRKAGQTAEADRHMARFKAIRAASGEKQNSELVQFLKVER
jgi:tetratricopeptide (TPR) repeat protein